ncbi:MAG: hypothetical protein DLM72_17095 [Candidatus Nitrosopolaris wilkensis]|nr:MAG: hypothetical protein DLM72_17095 [Candidatus Nitrosopolaris wilkensis]
MLFDYAPFVGTIGGGFVAGTLVGYAIKKVIKIAAIIVGLFIAGLAYLQYQRIIHVDWTKFQSALQEGLTTLANTIIHISNNIGTNHTIATYSDFIPLTSSVSAGFVLGILRG